MRRARPDIFQQVARRAFAERRDGIAEPIESARSGARQRWFHPWRPPLQPQSERQRSIPWAQLQEVSSTISASHVRRELGQELAVIRQLRQLLIFNEAQGVGESHLPVAMMVAITFAVRGHMNHLCGSKMLGSSPVPAARQTSRHY
jgi:hypothetical protein